MKSDMNSNTILSLAKQACQSFVNENKCRTSFEVDTLLARTDPEIILKAAIRKGLRISESNLSKLKSSIWNAKSFYSFKPIGSQSVW